MIPQKNQVKIRYFCKIAEGDDGFRLRRELKSIMRGEVLCCVGCCVSNGRRRLPAPLHYVATSIIAPQVHLATAELQRRRVLRRHLDLPATLPHDAFAGWIDPGAPIAGLAPGRREVVLFRLTAVDMSGGASWAISWQVGGFRLSRELKFTPSPSP